MIKKIAILPFFLCFSFILNAQIFLGKDANRIVTGAEKVILNEENQSIQFIVLQQGTFIKERDILTWLDSTLLKNDSRNYFELRKSSKDIAGFTNYEFIQKIEQIKVEYAIYKVHCKDGRVVTANGEYYPSSQIENLDIYTKDQVTSVAIQLYTNAGIPKETIKSEYISKLYFPTKGKLILAHKIDLYATGKTLRRSYVYINAKTGELLFEENRIHTTNVDGTAVTRYCGTRTIRTDSVAVNNFHLAENGARKIHTMDLNTSTSYSSAVEFTDNNNYWNTTTNYDDAAYDAHFGAEKTWDYYYNTFSRNSYDDLGAQINSYIHYSTGFVNAFWDGTQMTYGDGDGTNYFPLTSTDVVGHEITHAVTEHSAGLVYANESGALNESFSDVFGVTIDYYANPSTANFLMGEQFSVSGVPFRTMNDPNASSHPDTYQGNYWDITQEVHVNSNVMNYWYYLICSGGSGVNDNSNSYSIASISMAHAAAIAYRTLTNYLTPNSTYADMRSYSIQSAIDLYGLCSNEEINVTNAWYAVGVGASYSNAVVAQFSASDTLFCGTPATVTFTNLSFNGTSYYWDFGDGGSSTLANPNHTYNSIGNFTVTLITTGSTSCGNSDTLILSNYIHVTNNPAPIPATCFPPTSVNCCGYGIINVSLNTINKNSGDASEGYKDFTCGNNTILIAGSTYQLSVTTGSAAAQYVRAFIDYNNDGAFSVAESVYTSGLISGAHTGYINTPLSALLNTPLRLRVISSSVNITSGCGSINYGQGEDYTIIFNAATAAPVADFVISANPVTVGTSVSLQDISSNAPSSWLWTINGGIPSTSTIQNPSTIFNTAGTYTITLVVSNAFGSDSISKVVSVVNSFTMCNPASLQVSTALSGFLYDSGGPTGNYQTYESCAFRISPPCCDSIKLSFNSFLTENGYDNISIYDGINTSGVLLYNGSGSTIPPITRAFSGNMYITFNTDGSSNYSGFEATWIAYTHSSTPPIANFTFTPNNPPLLDTVHFTDASSSSTISWNWDFGDGGISSLQNPTHVYATTGTHTVTLVAGSCYNYDTITQVIDIQTAPLVTYSVNSFNVSLGCNDSTDLQLLINNTSGGTLNWSTQNYAYSSTNKMLIWTYGVNPLEYQNTKNAIDQYYTSYTFDTTSTTSPSVLQSMLVGRKVLLLPAKFNGSVAASVIAANASVISNFAQNGGMVIFCGDQITVDYTGIFNSSFQSYTSGANVNTINTTTPLSNFIPSTFYGSTYIIYRNLTNVNRTQVVALASNSDVVTYMPYGSGKAVYIGFSYSAFTINESRIIANAIEWGMNGFSTGNLVTSPTSGTTLVGSTDTVNIMVSSVGLSGGIDTMYVLINTNNPSSPIDSIPIYVNISSMPCVNFGHSQITTCTGVVLFADSTNNSPTSWLWNFGDGDTSTLQNPYHTYLNAGTYTVTLVASNSTGTDSISKVLTLSAVGGPLPASCIPTTTSPSAGYGISNVSFGTINNSSGNASLGYQDFTCSINTIITAGTQYQLKVSTFNASENVKVWIDFNNDGIFTASENISSMGTGTVLHQAMIIIPTSSIVFNTPLRMRVMSDYYTISTSCQNQSLGQTEDYTIIIQNPTTAPVANFIMSSNPAAIGSTIIFNDISSNAPTTWTWTINGGTVSSSTIQNVSSIFNTAGTYVIKLVVSNAYGIDSISKNIVIVSAFTMCNPTSVQSSSATLGFLFDSGGPTGYYQNYENCGFLINPPCADSIKLNFTSFYTESGYDNVRIYDGTNTSGILMYTGSGATIPPTTKAVSGNMYIQFSTDGSSVYPGFEASWTAYTHVSPPPVANFSFTPINPPLLDTVFFTDASSSSTTEWNWNFGDGGTSILENPSHVYSTSGTYTVTLIATSCFAYDTITQTITVQAPPTPSYSPSSFNVSLGCHDTVDLSLFIGNTAGGTLNWNTTSGTLTSSNVLAWNASANSSCYSNTFVSLNQYFNAYNLTTSSAITSAALQTDLIGKDILLIPSKYYTAASIVTTCSTAIQNFVQNGGTVIMCGDEITPLNSGIFQGSISGYFSSGVISTVNTTTPLSNNVSAAFYMQPDGYNYSFMNFNKVEVCSYLGNDVVTYVPYGNGKAIYIGYSYYNIDTNFGKLLANAVQWGSIQNSPNISISPSSGTITVGNSDSVHIQLNSNGLSGGLDTMYLVFNTNNPTSPHDSIPIYLAISNWPCVNFGYLQTTSCSGSVNFKDSTNNSPTAWHWDFGDGGTSTLQNPTHTYSTAGTYTVTLVVSNITCTDSMTKVISLTAVNGPISASCIPTTTSPSYYYGIQNVSFNTINNTSLGSVSGYEDFTCSIATNLYAGNPYTLNVTTFYNYENVNVWIDYNNDGVFSTSENAAIMNSTGNLLHTAIINIPYTGSPLGVPLRLRLISESGSLSSACQNPYYGQCEDYTVVINSHVMPVAAFMANPLTAWVGQNVQYTDMSQYGPTSWNWNLPGATPSSSIIQNPSVVYNAAGTYNATLKASNSFGSDSTTYFNYIHVYPLPNSGITYQVNPCTGEVTFNGGLPNPYTNNSWDFGDGNSTNIYSPTINHIYTSSGNYVVTFIAMSPYGNDTVVENIIVSLWTPTVTHTGTIALGSPITFDVTSNLPIVSYTWNFGDGSAISNTASPTHVYTTSGTFIVSVELVYNTGCHKIIYETIVIPGNGDNNDVTVKVSPNPFEDYLIIDVANIEKANRMDIRIMNNLGEIVFSKHEENITLTNTHYKIIPKLARANYIMEVFIDNKKYLLKIVKR